MITTKKLDHVDRRRMLYIMHSDLPIGTLTEETNRATGEVVWTIRPDYENIEKLESRGEVVLIGGVDLDLRKEEYVRNGTPCFVKQRLIPECRTDDLRWWFDLLHMDHYDYFEFLARRHGACSMDGTYVSHRPDDVINPRAFRFPLDIPDHDTDLDGWLN